MNLMKKMIFLSLALLVLFSLNACQKEEASNEIRVGTIAGPETQLMEVAKQVALNQYDLKVTIIPFTDYTMPNAALVDGSIDANMFQTIPYLNADMKARDYKLSIIGKTFIYPMAIYSSKIKNINEVPNNAIVAIPNDPSNEARALLLLQKAGLVQLKPNVSVFATPKDITNNPKQLQLKELDAAQLPRVMKDVTIAVINTNYAIPAGLYPTKDGIFLESKDSPYANVVVVKTKDVNLEKAKELVKVLHSAEVLTAAQQLFKGQAVKAW